MLCVVEQLGLIEYAKALDLQRQKVAERKAGKIPDTLLLVEHPHVYTLGRNAKRQNLLAPVEQLEMLKAQVFEIDRGGDITYHGPGQLVGYPILDLTQHRRDLAWFMRSLEEVSIAVAADFGLRAERRAGTPGVWMGNAKLVAMGVHVSRWITSHGFAFNVNTDLGYFDWIIPCGLPGTSATSLEKLLGHRVKMETVTKRVVAHFGQVFGLEMVNRRQLTVNS